MLHAADSGRVRPYSPPSLDCVIRGAEGRDEHNTRDEARARLRLLRRYLGDPQLDSESDEWLLYWASSRGGPLGVPQVGRIDGDRGEFYADDVYEDRPIRVVYVWSAITPSSAHWEQAFSLDGGETWETNWIMESTRTS
jgi:hypothetical protein